MHERMRLGATAADAVLVGEPRPSAAKLVAARNCLRLTVCERPIVTSLIDRRPLSRNSILSESFGVGYHLVSLPVYLPHLTPGRTSMNRRECLSTAAAVAASSALLSEVIGQDNNPAAQVNDKTTT